MLKKSRKGRSVIGVSWALRRFLRMMLGWVEQSSEVQVLSQSPEGEQSDRMWSCIPEPSGRHTGGCGETRLENDAEGSCL